MKAVHLTPEEALQAFIDLNARVLLGIHWGTFDLAEEPLDEPPQRMLAEIRRQHRCHVAAHGIADGADARWVKMQ